MGNRQSSREKVFILILNYRKYKDTIDCIETLRQSELPKGVEFVIVDNSEDGRSKKELLKKFPKLKLIKTVKNLGFAGGNNLGINYALSQGAGYILIINPDVRVEKRFLKPLVVDLKRKTRAGLVAPAHRHEQKGLTFYGLGGSVDWSTTKCVHENQGELKERGLKQYEFVSFACVLIKRQVFEKVGLLDGRYFMYLEDVDYCLMAAQKGFGSWLDASVVVDHATSSSFKRPRDKLKYSFVSQLKFINKWLPTEKQLWPLIHTLFFYPYLYLLWSWHAIKAKGLKQRGRN